MEKAVSPTHGIIVARLEHRWAPWLLAVILAIWLPLSALCRDFDYDEGQYIAAIALMPTGLPFRDFLYLQTPLHPILLAPLAWGAKGFLVVALRLANAAMVGASMAIIYRTIRTQGGTRSAAWLAVALMALCEPIIFIAAVARNDVTPMLLETAGIALLLLNWRTPRTTWSFLLAGLFMGMAIATKIHFVMIAGAAGLFMLLRWRIIGMPAIAMYVAGGVMGCLPIAFFWWLAPDAFTFGVFQYPVLAPWAWYAEGDQLILFAPQIILLRLFRFTSVGPTLIALVLIVLSRRRFKNQGDVVLLLDIMIVAGLIASVLPQPIYKQYLAPLYPPLFMRLGLTFYRWPGHWLGRLAMIISIPAGLVETVHEEGGSIIANAITGKSPPYRAVVDAHWLGEMSRPTDRVAGLGPERFVDSGLVIDPRFSTGPFIYRTVNLVTPAQALQWRVVPQQQMTELFAKDPPDLIVTGGNRTDDVAAPLGLDERVDKWAVAHGWTAQHSPSGILTVYRRPEPR